MNDMDKALDYFKHNWDSQPKRVEEVTKAEAEEVNDIVSQNQHYRKECVGGSETDEGSQSSYSLRSLVEATHLADVEHFNRLNDEVDESTVHLKDEDGRAILTRAYLENLCKSDQRTYYATPEVNDCLYLHHKAFKYVRNMDMFPKLKCLYFNTNGCKSFLGLENCTNLLNLYLHDNCIGKIQGLENLKNLAQLNVSDNFIGEITGLSGCTKLRTLTISRNNLGHQQDVNSLDALKGLLECPSLENLDIQKNFITDTAVIDEIFVKMPNLIQLYAKDNEFVRHASQYRRSLMVKIPQLAYLDDKPVFEDDRRIAAAWFKGGNKQEQQENVVDEREQIRHEAKAERNKNAVLFKEMVEKAKADKKAFEEFKQQQQEENSNLSVQELLAEARKTKQKAEEKLQQQKKAGKAEEKILQCVEQGEEERDFVYVGQTELDLEDANKKIEELEKQAQAEEKARAKAEALRLKKEKEAKAKEEELKRQAIFEQIMNSKSTVSKEEVDRFRDVYGEVEEEEAAAMLLMNQENKPQNIQNAQNQEPAPKIEEQAKKQERPADAQPAATDFDELD